MKFFRFFLLLLAVALTVGGCKKDEVDPAAVDAQNLADIRAYIKANNLKADSSDTGLYWVITKEGIIGNPKSTSTVTVNYTGKYLDGKEFDANDNISFSLQSVIPGWTEGIPKLKTQGKGILLIPAKLGYGYNDYNGIPGGSVLIFDVELISFK